MAGDVDLWRVEEACANAYPCWREVRLDGWVVRAAGGPTRRINSANPLHAAAANPADVAAEARDLYGRVGQATLFRIPDMVRDAARKLDRLGFAPEGEVVTLATALRRGARRESRPVSLAAAPGAAWFTAWHGLRPAVDAAGAAAHRRSVEALVVPAAFATCDVDGQPVAVGYAALHRRIAVLESVVTHADHRGRGHGRAVVDALMTWAEAAGAELFVLQVEADNAPARALYAATGVTDELYRYRYRRGPER